MDGVPYDERNFFVKSAGPLQENRGAFASWILILEGADCIDVNLDQIKEPFLKLLDVSAGTLYL